MSKITQLVNDEAEIQPSRIQQGLMNWGDTLMGTPVTKPPGVGWEGFWAHLVLFERTHPSICS